MRKRLVDELRLEGYIRSEKVYRAMLRVPRELFVPPDYRDLAYDDRPLPIGHGQTISAPSIVAYMTELLDLDVGMKVLEVGTGSGYQAAVLAEIVAPSDVEKQYWGHVYSIERIKALADLARRNLEKAGYSDRVTVIVGDGSKGYSDEAPYDRIIITAAAPKIPEPLVEQLKPGGRLVIPVGGVWDQTLYLVEKTIDGRVEKKPTLPVLFVPLIGAYAWPEED
ncbi:MAG: protein-L-isoaspartate(D-aspartate) O-methyltransferase [Desulfurococcales archaeon]|nr:protein-L-isoaspartate(D-aspartate) O-methyltransferase [Desulfurococcales archaeon]